MPKAKNSNNPTTRKGQKRILGQDTEKKTSELWDSRSALQRALSMCASEAGVAMNYLAAVIYFCGLGNKIDINTFLETIANWYTEKTGLRTKVSDLGSSDRVYVVDGTKYAFQSLYRASHTASNLCSQGIAGAYAAVISKYNSGDCPRWWADTIAEILVKCTTAAPKSPMYIDPDTINTEEKLAARINDWQKRFFTAVRDIEESPNYPESDCYGEYPIERLAQFFGSNTVPEKRVKSQKGSSDLEDKIITVLKGWDKVTASNLAALIKSLQDLVDAKCPIWVDQIVNHLTEEAENKYNELVSGVENQPKGRGKTLQEGQNMDDAERAKQDAMKDMKAAKGKAA